MSRVLDTSCGCPPAGHPCPPEIPAGLETLALRQLAGFPEYRAAVLRAIGRHPALAGWRARGEGDLGVMLLEAWAYVLDVVGFYDARIAERAYLPTAPDAETAARLTALIGHRPRPAMAAKVQLAVTVDGADPVTLPIGTAFRSAPFADQAPQVFELTTAHTAWPERNRFELAPVRAKTFDGTLRFAARGSASANTVVIAWTSASAAAAVRILRVEPDKAADGETHQRAVLDLASGTLDALIGADYDDLQLAVLRFSAGETDIDEGKLAADGVNLDGYYPQLQAGTVAAVEVGGVLHAIQLTSVSRTTIVPAFDTTAPAGTPEESVELVESLLEGARPRITATKVTYTPAVTRSTDDGFRLHAVPFRLPPPFRPAATEIDLSDLQGSGALFGPVVLGEAPTGGSVIARGAMRKGALIPGEIVAETEGVAHLAPGSTATTFDPLRTPVELFGNVVEAVRGETVGEEILGSGDAGRAFQSFVLKKKPLAWVEDATRPDGRRPELTVRVDGFAWSHVATFFTAGPEDKVYTLRPEPDGGTRIVFGDGKRGARLPSGTQNVRCTYRFGAEGTTPPPGFVEQIARPVRGLKAVRGPLACVGGADAETADDIKETGPASALTLGRAVSLLDFEALARRYSGVVNAAAAWIWDERRQRAAVKLWTIAAGADVSPSLALWLAAQAAPDTLIVAEQAVAADYDALAITLRYAQGCDPAVVRPAVEAALFDDETGLLAPRNQRIGGALFRSQVVERIHRVAGVDAIESVLLDGVPMPAGVAAGTGGWLDLAALSTVS
ncbi:hypothetical protein ABC977_17020 [Thioalkalicoccus limnaeus]|uniref:Baseplate assembly protein n=1 Tax=Thioalkalicoccus limnaeus TaxID=120681 RepID=A0ABV4BKV1_9GAMM